MICSRCKSQLLMVQYNDHNFFFFCGECGDKNSELEIYTKIREQFEDVDYDEPMEDW